VLDVDGNSLTLSFAHLIAPVVTATSHHPFSDKIQNGDILVPTYPGCPGKWPLNEYSPAATTAATTIVVILASEG